MRGGWPNKTMSPFKNSRRHNAWAPFCSSSCSASSISEKALKHSLETLEISAWNGHADARGGVHWERGPCGVHVEQEAGACGEAQRDLWERWHDSFKGLLQYVQLQNPNQDPQRPLSDQVKYLSRLHEKKNAQFTGKRMLVACHFLEKNFGTSLSSSFFG